jgi:nucleoside phosphorylase
VRGLGERIAGWLGYRPWAADVRPERVGGSDAPLVTRGRAGSTKFAVLTITDPEFDAARSVLGLGQQIPARPYYVHALSAEDRYDVVLRQSAERTNHPAGKAIGRFIEHFRPEYILLIGTAGGVAGTDEVAIGDVFVPNYVEYCEPMKLAEGKNLTRKIPFDHPSLYLIENFARPLRIRRDWLQFVPADRPRAIGNRSLKAIVGGQVVSSEKIWSDPTNEQQKLMLALYDKAVAFETEAVGVATEVYEQRRFVHYNPQYLVIRGISDLVNEPDANRTRKDCTPFAAQVAAGFARCLITDLLQSPASA